MTAPPGSTPDSAPDPASGAARDQSPDSGEVAVQKSVVALAAISAEVLSVAEHEDLVARARAGAVVTFSGVVRDHDHGRPVTQLEYVGHPSAEELVAEIAGDIAGLPQVAAVAISHRVGLLGVGDIALVAAVSAAHRGDAFDACRQLVEEVKARLPIWKRQVFTDGEEEWVAAP